jgi:hypothetical protein
VTQFAPKSERASRKRGYASNTGGQIAAAARTRCREQGRGGSISRGSLGRSATGACGRLDPPAKSLAWERMEKGHPCASSGFPSLAKIARISLLQAQFFEKRALRDRRLLTGELVSGASSTTHLTWPGFEFLGLCVRFSHVMRSHWLERLLWQGPVSQDMRPSTVCLTHSRFIQTRVRAEPHGFFFVADQTERSPGEAPRHAAVFKGIQISVTNSLATVSLGSLT